MQHDMEQDDPEAAFWQEEERRIRSEEPDWLCTLREEAPGLDVSGRFIRQATDPPKLDREDFEKRVTQIWNQFGSNRIVLPQLLMDQLFDWAIKDLQLLNGYNHAIRQVQGEEFKQTMGFIRQELTRFKRVRKEIVTGQKLNPPLWMAEWSRAWLDSFEELHEKIEARLRSTQSTLVDLTALARMGHTEVESHLLLSAKSAIKSEIAGTELSRKLISILAAYAHASKLVPYKSYKKNDSEYLDLIKNRVHRAQRAKQRIRVLSVLFMLSAQSPAN